MLTTSLIYNEYLHPKRVGIFHLVGTVLPMEGGHQAVLGIHRPRDAKDFVPDDARRLERLVPHLQRALDMRRRLQQAEQASRSILAVLDRLSVGVIMLGPTGRLLHVNAAADAILRGADGPTRTPDGLRTGHKGRRQAPSRDDQRASPGRRRDAIGRWAAAAVGAAGLHRHAGPGRPEGPR